MTEHGIFEDLQVGSVRKTQSGKLHTRPLFCEFLVFSDDDDDDDDDDDNNNNKCICISVTILWNAIPSVS
jgi:hypothetical protein